MKLFALVNTIVVVVNQGESTYLHSLVYVKGKHFFYFSYSKDFHGISVLMYTRKWALRSYSTQTNGIGSALAIEYDGRFSLYGVITVQNIFSK